MADREDARRLSSLYHIDDDASSQAAAEIDGSEASDSEEELYASSHESLEHATAAPITSPAVKQSETAAAQSGCSSPASPAEYVFAKGLKLTQAQAKLFGLTSGVVDGNPNTLLATVLRQKSASLSPSKTKFTKKRLENLSQPKAGMRLAAAQQNNSDTAACTFTWKRSRKAEAAARNPACGYDFIQAKNDDQAQGGEDDFLLRMDAYTSHQRRKLSEQRAEEAYNDRLDKKSCPKCGAVQSFDEFVNNKLRCGQCNVTYTSGTVWQRSSWETRVKGSEIKSKKRLQKLEARVKADLEATRVAVSRQQKALKQQVGQKAFLERTAADVHKRVSNEKQRLVSTQTVDRAAFVPHIETSHSPFRALSAKLVNSNKIANSFGSSSARTKTAGTAVTSRAPLAQTAATAAAAAAASKPIAGIEVSKLNALLI
jgi:ribosomal protein S27AE